MELVQLKTCQNQIVTIALAGAGVMLGLAKDQTDQTGGILSNYLPFYFLSPLLILLPLWVIFFDKARTISRIIGFILNQEKLLFQNSELGILGWETAMEEYRLKKEDLDTLYIKKRSFPDVHRPDIPNKPLSDSVYWFIVYLVFFLLSLVCIIMSILSFKELFLKDGTIDIVFWGSAAFVFVVILIGSILLALFEDGTRKFQKIKKFCIRSGIVIAALILLVSFYLLFPKLSLLASLYWTIFVTFWIAYAICAGATMWFFNNLVNGRYSYREFEWRWKKILEIDDDKTGVLFDTSAKNWAKTTYPQYASYVDRYNLP
jgi:hypothetical protein